MSEDAGFPLQALEYWCKVEALRRQGYFSDLFDQVADAPALVYLVAPALRFHKNFWRLCTFVDSKVPLYGIGINSDWHRGLKIYFFKRAN